MDKMNEQKRNNTIDIIKGICIVFVILTHRDGLELGAFDGYITRGAVPVFMIISGYLYYKSLEKEDKIYSLEWIIKKTIRFLVPYICAFCIEMGTYYFFTSRQNLGQSFFELLICGGIGPGSYYVPIMFQFVLTFPFVYYVMKKDSKKGLAIVFSINVIYEILQNIINMDDDLYRILIFRYLFLMAIGAYIATTEDKYCETIAFIMVFVGAVFIYIFNFTNYSPIIFSKWKTTSIPTTLFWIPIVSYLIKKIKVHNVILENLGKASFNIYLTQTVYFFMNVLKRFTFKSLFIYAILDIIICCLFGYVFYIIENRFTNRLLKKIVKNN